MFCVCRNYIQDQSFNNFENNKMKLSVNKAKLSGLWTRNCADIPQVWNLKFAFRPKKVSWHFKKRAPGGNSVLSQSSKNHQKNTYLKFTLLQLNKDHMKGNDKQDHVQTWEFWCDNTVHTKRHNQSVRKVQCTWCILFTVIWKSVKIIICLTQIQRSVY